MIGIDVGGANTKLVDDNGVHIHYCPLWEGAPLASILRQYKSAGQDVAAVVMSGELADCFGNKLQGIAFIVDAVREVFPDALFYGTDAAFHRVPVPQLAAANWLAAADLLRERYPNAVLVDVGSTTADIIPLARFNDLRGLTDLRRLQKGHLIYTGMLRTNIVTLLSSVNIHGIDTPVSAEYFATSADVHLVLNHIYPEGYSCDTPDKKEKTKEAALRRLARVVCADLEEIGEDGAMQVAGQFWERQRTLIVEGIQRVVRDTQATSVIVAGIGAPLFAQECGGIVLSDKLGAVADALPAYAVREIACRDGSIPGLPVDRCG
ncbi:MAG: H4MPT-linked C1 transfer pathway protein [Methanoregula sp.]|nr:H4MPT-linked C1 transfer pathway protein [Methanoregula sp.]